MHLACFFFNPILVQCDHKVHVNVFIGAKIHLDKVFNIYKMPPSFFPVLVPFTKQIEV